MRYYPLKLNVHCFRDALSECIQTIHKDTLFLTNHGFYKYVGDTLYKYKISIHEKEDIIQKKYIHNIDFIINHNQWIKQEEEYHIPIESTAINLERYIFLLSAGSNTKFVIEKHEDTISDYYFISKENMDHHSLKEDIGSFLSLLN